MVEGKDTEAVEAVRKAEAATKAAATVEAEEEEANNMQQRVWCYACVALLRREQTGTCSRTGIGHTA